jgi:hypothetical protein
MVPAGVRYALREQFNQLQRSGVRGALARNAVLADAWVREQLNRRHYRVLSEAALRRSRKSDTVFVFGSGYSLNELAPDEWAHFTAHDVFGFNAFVYERWIPIDFHLLRGGVEGAVKWRAYAEEFTETLNANPHCANTRFLVQGEYLAQFCNQLIGYRYLKPGTAIFRYTTNRGSGPPTSSFHQGLRHEGGTLSDAVNAAFCLGWNRIVLVGVDLYDSRYFWLKPDETYGVDEAGRLVPAAVNLRGHRPHETHNTARNGVVDIMGRWREWLEREHGVSLTVYNPRSLLAGVMPVYQNGMTAMRSDQS